MKSLFISRTKLPEVFLGILFLVFCFGCQKDFNETENALEPVSLKSATVASPEIKNYLVITKAETLPADFESQLSDYGEIVSSIPEIGMVVIKPFSANFEKKVANLAGVLAAVPDLKIKWIEPDRFVSEANPPSIGNNESFFNFQWGMDAINAPEAWNAEYTGSGARVFILDSGIDANNPDLLPNLNTELSKSFVPDENYYVGEGDFFNHGTHVAGIIAAADNDWGVIGVAPHAEIVAVKVISEETGYGDFSWINAGIVYAADNGADVINMSLGATFNRNGFYVDDDGNLQKIPASYIVNFILAQQRAVNYAFKKGVTIVVSGGNGGSDFDGNGSIFKLPAELQNVIAVSATAPYNWYYYFYFGLTTNLDIPASYIDYGKSLVELAAPGGDFDSPEWYYYMDGVISTGAGPNADNLWPFYYAAGTSMASPHVAGVAALIIGKNGGKMSPIEVTKQLFKTADKIDDNGMSAYYGYGRVNAFRAVTE
jgi:subtilisin family serine protease